MVSENRRHIKLFKKAIKGSFEEFAKFMDSLDLAGDMLPNLDILVNNVPTKNFSDNFGNLIKYFKAHPEHGEEFLKATLAREELTIERTDFPGETIGKLLGAVSGSITDVLTPSFFAAIPQKVIRRNAHLFTQDFMVSEVPQYTRPILKNILLGTKTREKEIALS